MDAHGIPPLLCGFSGTRLGLEKFLSSGVFLFASFGASTNPPRVFSRGWVCPSRAWCRLRSDRYDFDAKVFNRRQVSCSNYSHEIMIYSTGYLFWESCLSVFSGLLGTVCSFCLLCLSAVIFTLLSSVNPIKFSTPNAGIFLFQSLSVSMYDFYFLLSYWCDKLCRISSTLRR